MPLRGRLSAFATRCLPLLTQWTQTCLPHFFFCAAGRASIRSADARWAPLSLSRLSDQVAQHQGGVAAVRRGVVAGSSSKSSSASSSASTAASVVGAITASSGLGDLGGVRVVGGGTGARHHPEAECERWRRPRRRT